MRKALICFIIIFMGLPLMAQVKIKEKVEIKPEESNLKSSSSTVIYLNGIINGFVMPKSGMLQVYYTYLRHLDLPMPYYAELRTNFLKGDSTKSDSLVPRFPDLITSPRYINDFCNSTISSRFQYIYSNNSAPAEVSLYKAGSVNAGDTVQYLYYSDLMENGNEFLYGVYDASEVKLSDGTIAGWDIRFGYYDNCIQDFNNVLQISIGIVDPCHIDNCGDDWKPTEITDANFKIVKEGDSWSWIDNNGFAFTEQIQIPDNLCNGLEAVTYIADDINSQYKLFQDMSITVCKAGDNWKFNVNNLKIPIVYGNCVKADGATIVDLNTGGNEDIYNSYIDNCEKFKYLKRLLEFYEIGRYTPQDTLLPLENTFGLPWFISEEGALDHEIVHTKQIVDKGEERLNQVLQRFNNHKIRGNCPEDVKSKLDWMLMFNLLYGLDETTKEIYKETKDFVENRKLNYSLVDQYLNLDTPGKYVYKIPIAELDADKNASATFNLILEEFNNWGRIKNFDQCN